MQVAVYARVSTLRQAQAQTRACKILGCWRGWARFWAHRGRVGPVPKLMWRLKLVAELRPGVVTETEVARIERDEQAGLADLGLRLAETKQGSVAKFNFRQFLQQYNLMSSMSYMLRT